MTKRLKINVAKVVTSESNLAFLLDSIFSALKKMPKIIAPKLGKKITNESK